LGAVRLLLGFTLMSSKSMFSVWATTWATCEHYGLPVKTMGYLWTLWATCEHYGLPVNTMGYLWTLWPTCEHYGLNVTLPHTWNDDVNKVKHNLMTKVEQTCMNFYTLRIVYNLVVLWIKGKYG
jgi:hypothetical protein